MAKPPARAPAGRPRLSRFEKGLWQSFWSSAVNPKNVCLGLKKGLWQSNGDPMETKVKFVSVRKKVYGKAVLDEINLLPQFVSV